MAASEDKLGGLHEAFAEVLATALGNEKRKAEAMDRAIDLIYSMEVDEDDISYDELRELARDLKSMPDNALFRVIAAFLKDNEITADRGSETADEMQDRLEQYRGRRRSVPLPTDSIN